MYKISHGNVSFIKIWPAEDMNVEKTLYSKDFLSLINNSLENTEKFTALELLYNDEKKELSVFGYINYKDVLKNPKNDILFILDISNIQDIKLKSSFKSQNSLDSNNIRMFQNDIIATFSGTLQYLNDKTPYYRQELTFNEALLNIEKNKQENLQQIDSYTINNFIEPLYEYK